MHHQQNLHIGNDDPTSTVRLEYNSITWQRSNTLPATQWETICARGAMPVPPATSASCGAAAKDGRSSVKRGAETLTQQFLALDVFFQRLPSGCVKIAIEHGLL